MDFDNAKENIQPLAGGRNARRLEETLSAESHHEALLELQSQRKDMEAAIEKYNGEDPLEPWFEYILWIEQSYPSGGKESGLEEVLSKCLTEFENDQRYFQDRRMIKLYIKYIDTQPNPPEFYQELYNQGIGTMVPDLYICWAYYHDLSGNFQKANGIYQKGIDARAQPFEELDQAHKHFGFTMSQRILYQDQDSQQGFINSLHQRRNALTSLRTHRKQVGSIRTGTAVKNLQPGKIQIGESAQANSNIKVSVFEDQNYDPNHTPVSQEQNIQEPTIPTSVVRSIIDSTRKQENLKEPGPWTKAKIPDKRKNDLFDASSAAHVPSFAILEDDSLEVKAPLPNHPNNYIKGIQLLENHVQKNDIQPNWKVALRAETEMGPGMLPMYDKILLYPNSYAVFSPEELRGYKWFKKRNAQNNYTIRMDTVWSNDYMSGFRLYPYWPKTNIVETEIEGDERFVPVPDDNILSGKAELQFNIEEIYPPDCKEEYQREEILFEKWKSGSREKKFAKDETIFAEIEMEETICVSNNRRSMFPNRKSIISNRVSVVPNTFSIKKIPQIETEPNCSKTPDTSLRRSVIIENPKILGNLSLQAQNTSVPPIFNVLTENETLSKDSIPSTSNVVSTSITAETSAASSRNLADGANSLMHCNFSAQQNSGGGSNNDVNVGSSEIIPGCSTIIPSRNVDGASSLIISKNLTGLAPSFNYLKQENLSHNKSIVTEKSIPAKSDLAESFNIAVALTSAIENVSIENVHSVAPSKFSNILPAQEFPQLTENKDISDKIEVCTTGEQNEYVFKTPAPPAKSNTFQIFEDDNDNDDEVPVVFGANETCSTQTFNLFIKAQSVSTPKHARKSHIPRLVQSLDEPQTAIPEPVVVSPTIENDMQPVTTTIVKQLSTIMETTESNTGSSAISASTKFSADTQISSPEYDSDPSKSNQVIKPPINVVENPPHLDKLPDGFELNKKTVHASYMEKEETVPSVLMSMKVFEERTETVPNVLIKPAATTSDLDSFYKIFVKTPEKKKTLKQSNSSLVDDSFSYFKDMSYPKISNLDISTHQEKKEKSLLKPNRSIIPGFEDEINDHSVMFETKQDNNPPASHEFIPANKKLNFSGNFEAQSFKTIKANESLNFSNFKEIKEEKCNQDDQNTNVTNASIIKKDSIKCQSFANISLCPDFKNFSFGNKLQPDSCNTKTESKTMVLNEEVSATTSKTTCPNFQLRSDLSHENVATTSKLSYSRKDNYKKESSFSGARTASMPVDEQFQEKSIHIKDEIGECFSSSMRSTNLSERKSILNKFSEISLRQLNSSIEQPKMNALYLPDVSITLSAADLEAELTHSAKEVPLKQTVLDDDKTFLDIQDRSVVVIPEENEMRTDEIQTNARQSIYVNYSTKTPIMQRHIWEQDENFSMANQGNDFLHGEVDLNYTREVIDDHLMELLKNPFDIKITTAFLDQMEFYNFLTNYPTCKLVNKVPLLKKQGVIEIAEAQFEISKLIGEGSYGTVWCGKCRNTGNKYALKQERPANFWEYYICIELKDRIKNMNVLQGFMDIEYALIGNNSSVFVSKFSKYGSLISVCNKFKLATDKNLDEYIVMMIASQLLSIIDHLHGANIIHADIKPDNILLVSGLTYGERTPAIQLIDFGISIDMELYPADQTFIYMPKKKDNFSCIEMLEGLPWSFQTDLFGVAGTIHALLFGLYMDVEKRTTGWDIKTRIPRYFNRIIWSTIFSKLLNIPDCKSMPNLQSLRLLLDEEVVEKSRFVKEKVNEFNLVITSK